MDIRVNGIKDTAHASLGFAASMIQAGGWLRFDTQNNMHAFIVRYVWYWPLVFYS